MAWTCYTTGPSVIDKPGTDLGKFHPTIREFFYPLYYGSYIIKFIRRKKKKLENYNTQISCNTWIILLKNLVR